MSMPDTSPGPDSESVRRFFESRSGRIQYLRRALHAIPELGFSEVETSAYIQKELDSLGVAYTAGVGGTGIVARIGGRGSETAPRVAIRADIDGLPIHEAGDAPYRSRHDGLMHACGHDAHAGMLLGIAEYFASIGDDLPGEVLLVFQPAEERSDGAGLTGARYILKSGLLDGVLAVIGMHVMSGEPAGRFGILPGAVMASGDMFRATIHGRGGHDAMAHQTIDPVFLATQVLNVIYAIRSRKIGPTVGGTISVGTIEAGTTANVIPERATMSGTIRTFDPAVRELFVAELQRALKVAEVLGGNYELEIPFHVPVTWNDGGLAALAREACVGLFGQESLYDCEPTMAVEDFSWYGASCPSLFIMLGAAIDDGIQRPHHNPAFDIDDSVLYRGSALLAMTALRILSAPDGSAPRSH